MSTNFPHKIRKIIEVLPPKGASADDALKGTLAFLRSKGADCFSVPSNPRGIPHQSNSQFYEEVFHPLGYPAIVHLTLRHHTLYSLQQKLLHMHFIGIRHLLLIMGDAPISSKLSSLPMGTLDTIDALKFIKKSLNQGIDFRGSPLKEKTDFTVGCALNPTPLHRVPGMEEEPFFQMRRLEAKIRAGADFIVTQPLFDLDKTEEFLDRYERLHGPLPVPLICALLLLNSPSHWRQLSSIPGIHIPKHTVQKWGNAKNLEKFQQSSLTFALQLSQKLSSLRAVNGFYLVSASSNYDLVGKMLELLQEFSPFTSISGKARVDKNLIVPL